MKIKPVYIYLAIFVIAVLIIVTTSNNSNQEPDEPVNTEAMPNDDIHKGLQQDGSAPGRDNVNQSVIQELEQLRKTVEENPDDTLSVRKYAEFLSQAHNPQKAVELYKTILAKDSKRIDILLGITFAYYNMRDINSAEEYTNKVLALDKNNHEANYNLGAIAFQRGNTQKAKEIWQNVIKKFPNSSVAQLAENSIKNLEGQN